MEDNKNNKGVYKTKDGDVIRLTANGKPIDMDEAQSLFIKNSLKELKKKLSNNNDTLDN